MKQCFDACPLLTRTAEQLSFFVERLFYYSRMPIPPTGLSRAMVEAAAAMPVGWHVAGMVQESESWRAWAVPGQFAGNPEAAPIEGHGGSTEQALLSLARNARAAGGQPATG